MNYYILFDENGKRKSTVPDILADDWGGKDKLLQDSYIVISDTDYDYYVGNKGQGANGTGYIYDKATGKPIDAPPIVITPAQVKAQKIKTLSANFEKQKNTITNAYMSAALADNQNAMTAMQTNYKKLIADYHKALQTIQ